MTTLSSRNRPNGHTHELGHTPTEVQCPYCGQPISRKEYKEIHARIEAEERARIAKVEANLKARVAREVSKAQTEAKVAIETARGAAEIAAKKLELIRQNQRGVVAAAVEAERKKSSKKRDEVLAGERASHFAEKLRLESALADMQRRLQAKTAHQLGEPAEIDLYDALVAAFPGDRISRVVKGQRGPDVIVEVMHGGVAVGSIVLDSKNHRAWQNKFTSKLRADQRAEGADFAILSTSVFPAGAQQLHIQDGVIVATPARVPVLVNLLRRQIVDNHRLKLTVAARDEKAEKLLTYVVSPEANDLFVTRRKAADDMISLECKEVDQHHATWRKRGELIRVIQKADEELLAAIDRIIDGSAHSNAAEQEVAA